MEKYLLVIVAGINGGLVAQRCNVPGGGQGFAVSYFQYYCLVDGCCWHGFSYEQARIS